MSEPRSTYRRRYGVLLALCIVLALGSLWLVQIMNRQSGETAPKRVRTEPDYYVEKFSFTQLSVTGSPRYRLAGDHLTHNPLDDSFDVVLPVMNSLDKARPPMLLRADTAHVEDNNGKINLSGNVVADRPKTPAADNFHLTTEFLVMYPNYDVMTSDRLVKIVSGQSTLNGVGMYANNATRILKLGDQVHGRFPPQPSTK